MDIGVVGDVVMAAGLLHNFIIDQRDPEDDDAANRYFSSFSHSNLRRDNQRNEEVPVAMVTDNNARKPSGRPSNNDTLSKEKGNNMRRSLCWSLESHGLKRPCQSGFKYNSYGMLYMES